MWFLQYSWFIFFPLWRCSPTRAMASSFLRFLDHTQRHITVCRTSLDEWSARRRNLHLTTHNTHNRQTSMPPGGIRTHSLSRRAAADLRLRPRGHWDRQMTNISELNTKLIDLCVHKRSNFVANSSPNHSCTPSATPLHTTLHPPQSPARPAIHHSVGRSPCNTDLLSFLWGRKRVLYIIICNLGVKGSELTLWRLTTPIVVVPHR